MGNMCIEQNNQIPKQIILQTFNQDLYFKCTNLSIRMGQVEKLNSTNIYQPNRFLFILPIKQSQQFCKIQCPVISSYSHHLSLNVPILSGIDKVRLNTRSCPILDLHDPVNDRQIMHKFTIMNQTHEDLHYTLKVYPFTNNHHDVFKNGLYEAYLYRCIESYTRISIMKDFFILQKGIPSSLVFIFGSYLSSLQDILLYRSQFNMPYTKDEQIFICDQILNKYKILLENNIIHRDIRPSKIYLADTLQSARGHALNILGYQLLNLQSARKLSSRQIRIQQYQQDGNMLMSIRGVPLYSQGNVLNYYQNKQQIGMYNPWHNDRIQLAKTLAMLVTFQINLQQINYQDLKRKNKFIYQLVTDLQNFSIPVKNIIRDFHQNYGSKLSFINGILRSDYTICKTNIQQYIKSTNKQRIQKSTTQVLYILHQQQLIHQRINKIINHNFQHHQYYNNVAIYQRLGQHYQGMGMSDNQYYIDQLHLLIQLSFKARIMCVNNQEFMAAADQLYDQKFFRKVHDPVINVDYKVQNAYLALKKGDVLNANKLINDAFFEGASSKIPIETQLKLLQAKGVIQTARNGTESGNFYFQKGLDLAHINKNFTIQQSQIKSIGNFQFLLGKNYLTQIQLHQNIIPQDQQIKQISKCQQILINAKQKLSIDNKNPVKLAHINEALGDICLFREDNKGAKTYYQSSNTIYKNHSQQIGRQQQIRMLQKLYKYHHQHSQNYTQQQQIKFSIQNIKKKQDLKSNIDHKKIFKRIRQLKSQNKSTIINQNQFSIIHQDEQFQQESASPQRQSLSQHTYQLQQKQSVNNAQNQQQALPLVQNK